MTYAEWKAALAAAGIPDAGTDARLLIERFEGVSSVDQRADPRREYISEALAAAVARRQTREPLQYILGEWQFCRETYTVDENCLIPRADTEVLVEYAASHLPSQAHFADLCTGSGCIAVSTLAARPDTTCDAIELYAKTLELAKHNAERNGVAERFRGIRADVLLGEGVTGQMYDAILSNPPYIPTGTVGTLEPEVGFEPRVALDGGEDGMRYYRAILTHYRTVLRPGGMFLFEIGYDEGDAMRRLVAEYGFVCRILPDLGGNDRLAVLTEA